MTATLARRGDLVVIGFAEALSGPEVAWSLIDAGFRVAAFARQGGSSALRCSRHVDVFAIAPPERHIGESLEGLTSLLGSFEASAGRLIILPIDDAALFLCSQLDPRPGWTFAGARGDCARLALDKRQQIERAVEAGFNVPETRFVAERDALPEAVVGYPVIVRPSNAVSVIGDRMGKGRNWICSDEAELLQVHAQWGGEETLMTQPFLTGIGEGVFGLAHDDEVLAWSGHRRLRMMNPQGSGSSACAARPVPDEVKAPVETFVRACGWRGMFMFELLRTADDRLWFVEFNGRAWGSMALARKQKLEYPAWTVCAALEPGWRCDPPAALREKIECRNLGREVMHLLFVLRGPRSKALGRWPSFWSTLLEMARPRRPVYLYNWRASDWRVFFCDFWRTIRGHLFKQADRRR